MTKKMMQVKIAPNAAGGSMTTEEGEHPFISRLFADDQWRPVSLEGQKGVGGLPLDIYWEREDITPCWLSLKATLTNKGKLPIRLGSFHMMEGGNLGTEVAGLCP